MKKKAKVRPGTKLGLWLTALWMLGNLAVFVARFADAASMSLNEWGDFLAGVTAPIGLLWLVLGYFQQSAELRISTEVLRAQQKELKNQVEQTSELARTANANIEDRRKEATPLFERRYSSGSLDSGRLRIINRGQVVRELKVECHGANVAVPCVLTEEFLDSGSSVDLEVRGNDDSGMIYPLEFLVSCYNHIGHPHSVRYRVKDRRDSRPLQDDGSGSGLAESRI